MDDQTKPSNDLYNNDYGQVSDRPLTSFLQARQAAVKTVDDETDSSDTVAAGLAPATDDFNDVAAGLAPATDDLNDVAAGLAPVQNQEVEPAVEPLENVSAGLVTATEDSDGVAADLAPAMDDSDGVAAACLPAGRGLSLSHDEVETEDRVIRTESEIDQNKLNTALKALRQIEQQIATVIKLLETGDASAAVGALKTADVIVSAPPAVGLKGEDLATLKPIDGRVVEGVFDGRGMVGADGKNYMVPPNYASKSKLVEGDMLKLTITPKGSFIYKQIGPIERSRLIGSLGFDQTIGEYYATSENRRWNVIKASVTYFKGEPGDEVVLLVPKNTPSKWAAVENIIKRNPLG